MDGINVVGRTSFVATARAVKYTDTKSNVTKSNVT